MKILVDAHCFDYGTTEGINTYLQGLYSALVETAPGMEFYFAAKDVLNLEKIFGKHPNVHYITLGAGGKFRRLLFEFPELIRRHRIDYAHFQYTSPPFKNCKTIVTLHDILFLDFPQYFPRMYRITKNILFRLSAKKADILLTVSAYSKNRISAHYGIDQSRIAITHNAVEEKFSRTDAAEARALIDSRGIGRYLLYVSRIEPRKNHIRLLNSYLRLRLWEKGYDLVMIGKKTIPVPELERVLESLPPETKRHIHVLNQVPYEELLYWYKAASLFVYPSLAEGFGIPPLEAAMSGVPCICSGRTAMSEYDFFGSNLLDVEDEHLFNDSIERNLWGEEKQDTYAICEEIRSRYNWNVSARTLYNILSSGIDKQ